MKDSEIQRLLLDCGFQTMPPAASMRWQVAGRVEGGGALKVSCAGGARGGWVLLVHSSRERQQLLSLLAHKGVVAVDVRAEQMEAGAPWLAVGVGLTAVTLFGWVLTSIPTVLP